MDSLPVTLIVKAPNQQIEDQKIRCETSWSINKLKQHLSEVYPSKPPHHEQKLIYSGQLLNDTVILKDILRQYEGQDTHTVHLVCTPKQAKMASSRPKQTTPVLENPSGGTSRQEQGSSPERTNTQPENTPQNNATANNRVPPAYPNAQFAPNGYPWSYFNGQIPQAPQVDFNALNQYQMQMAWMQQAYLQYVQAQYMQLATGQPLIPPPQTVPTPAPPANNHIPNAQPQEVPQAAAAQENVAAAAQPQQQQQPENEEHDWLDVFYMLSRAMVLFSVVYFYSSPLRFVFVLFLGVALYLYQAGFFRHININNNNIDGAPDGAAPQEEQAPTGLMVAWTFITTFFASLVPEVPNINA
ncbi:homocysteine-responsive endoplasmic reticulum-resident ubiquitin-like domain member 2 protein [Anthonomus grandis grandis]|uniref:homocysteine-responsive endoplasmic reticulum-resident ubiquitin-like domain member 2 protein n=1 Tax=Anthonomus grandis grandis TaxID=2921223 RepID=UPI00216534D5|nr:homocysteine-responsive endoplasmic reticulum-resident ubiquitin-like domain member 2 protein [Anthonomus grandis grandis]